MEIVYEFRDIGAYAVGIPSRDLTADEVAQFSPEQVELLNACVAGGMYIPIAGKFVVGGDFTTIETEDSDERGS